MSQTKQIRELKEKYTLKFKWCNSSAKEFQKKEDKEMYKFCQGKMDECFEIISDLEELLK
jgi:hypothetical protein